MQGAHRGGKLQNWSMQSVSEGEGVYDEIREIGLQWEIQCGPVQAANWPHASDPCAFAVFRYLL